MRMRTTMITYKVCLQLAQPPPSCASLPQHNQTAASACVLTFTLCRPSRSSRRFCSRGMAWSRTCRSCSRSMHRRPGESCRMQPPVVLNPQDINAWRCASSPVGCQAVPALHCTQMAPQPSKHGSFAFGEQPAHFPVCRQLARATMLCHVREL